MLALAGRQNFDSPYSADWEEANWAMGTCWGNQFEDIEVLVPPETVVLAFVDQVQVVVKTWWAPLTFDP